jgi:hypothetical protein
MCNEYVQYEYSDHMTFFRKVIRVDLVKAKEQNCQRNKSSGYQRNDSSGQRVRTWYNCNDRFHFVVECLYEKRIRQSLEKSTHLPQPKIMAKGSFFVVNGSLPLFFLPWCIDRYGSFCHHFSMTMLDVSIYVTTHFWWSRNFTCLSIY